MELLEAMREEGAEGFAVCAVNDPAIQNWIAARMEEGVPCVTFNSDLPESGRLCFVGQSIRQAGRVAAGLLFKCISGQGPILATAGNLKFDGHRQRLDGFRERLEELVGYYHKTGICTLFVKTPCSPSDTYLPSSPY